MVKITLFFRSLKITVSLLSYVRFKSAFAIFLIDYHTVVVVPLAYTHWTLTPFFISTQKHLLI